MNLSLVIERLVLTGGGAAPQEREALERSIERELARLLDAEPAGRLRSRSVDAARSSPLVFASGGRTDALARGIAQSIHAQVAPPAPAARGTAPRTREAPKP